MMATLIRPNSRPSKWLVKQQFDFLPANTLLRREFLLRANFSAEFITTRELVRQEIKSYCSVIEQNRKKGIERAIRRYKAELVIDTILTLISWKNTLYDEALSAELLSKKIATNILNNDNLTETDSLTNMYNEIRNLISCHVAIPHHMWHETNQALAQLPISSDKLINIVTHQREKGAELWINAPDLPFMVDFHEEDIIKILAKVSRRAL